MAISIKGGASGNLAAVDANLSLQINPPMSAGQAGFTVAAGEVTDGIGGAAILRRPLDVSPDYRLRSGVDQTLWFDVFNHGVLNTSKYKGVTATMTNSMAAGFLQMNTGSALASGNVTNIQTWRTFTFPLSGALYADFHLALGAQPVANNVVEFGMGYAATTVAPTDGCFFRLTTAGLWEGVAVSNSVEHNVNLTGLAYVANMINHFLLVMNADRVEFWFNDRMYGAIDLTGTGQMASYSSNLPALFRVYNASAVGSAQILKIAAFGITQADLLTNRLWATTQAGQGLSAVNAPDGVTAGQTANYGNSTIPTSCTLSNTAAGYTTLGGQWQFAAVAGAETDYALFSYLVPQGIAALPGKNLIVRGIHIESWNMGAAVATTPFVLQWGLGIGGSAISLATADNATTGVKAHRRITLGGQFLPIGAVIGQQANALDINLDAPIMVESGCYLTVILKIPVGTATASEIIRGTCLINGYFE
jgi:hypothetical protein